MNTPQFDSVPDRRHTNSLKWDKYPGKDILPLWVADMDFMSPPEVIDAAVAASKFGNFGYAKCPPSLVEAVIERCNKLYKWKVEPSWIVWLPGMVCALNVCCRALEKDNPKVYTQTPIYPPFLTAPGNFGLSSERIPMKLEGDRFTFDFETIENLDTKPGDLFMLCHPHNPVGTAFTEQELIRLSKWITENNLFICSDEIHCDLILDPDSQHFPIASLAPELSARCITLMAPSKTFNLPGFGCSFAVISDSGLRIKFKKALQGIVPDPPAMGFLLAEKAYRFGEPWRHELLAYLRKNRDLAYTEISKMPNLRPFCPEATYLLWIDANSLPVDNPHQYFEQHGVGLSDGKDFGAPGFLRLNLGCTYDLLKKALLRMENACKALS